SVIRYSSLARGVDLISKHIPLRPSCSFHRLEEVRGSASYICPSMTQVSTSSSCLCAGAANQTASSKPQRRVRKPFTQMSRERRCQSRKTFILADHRSN
ncbi:hypothetical protein T310_6306, partial [Rasamsonia emersonii CBS 393.64]